MTADRKFTGYEHARIHQDSIDRLDYEMQRIRARLGESGLAPGRRQALIREYNQLRCKRRELT